MAGIQVSNHGGRQLDGVPASIDTLGPIAEAVDRRVPIIVDSGFRRGGDVFKALALGADAVAMGRPVMYGLALGGADGVKSVYDKLAQEISLTMRAAGRPQSRLCSSQSPSQVLSSFQPVPHAHLRPVTVHSVRSFPHNAEQYFIVSHERDPKTRMTGSGVM